MTAGKMISENIILARNLKHPKVDVMREVGVNCREKPVVMGKRREC